MLTAAVQQHPAPVLAPVEQQVVGFTHVLILHALAPLRTFPMTLGVLRRPSWCPMNIHALADRLSLVDNCATDCS